LATLSSIARISKNNIHFDNFSIEVEFSNDTLEEVLPNSSNEKKKRGLCFEV
jgi:hypothetical protein